MNNYLAHYGVKGQKHGVRRFQNEDGSLTSEGRSHYGVGDPRKIGSSSLNSNPADHNYRVKRFGKSSAKLMERKPKEFTPEEKAKRDAKRKKIIAAAAGITVAAIVAGVAIKQHQKTTRNLIETAKNKVDHKFVTKQNELDRAVNYTKRERAEAQARLDAEKMRDMLNVNSRRSAKKVLGINGLKNQKAANKFIKDHKLRTTKTSAIVEKRTGRLIEAAHRNRLTKKMAPVSEKTRRRLAEKMVKTQHRQRRPIYYL